MILRHFILAYLPNISLEILCKDIAYYRILKIDKEITINYKYKNIMFINTKHITFVYHVK